MPRLGALLLLTAGIALGSYCYLFPPANNETDLAEITRISAAPDRDYRSDATIRTFSPSSPVFREVIPEDASAADVPASPKNGTWTAVVASEQAVVTPLRSSRPGDPETRAGLASDLQTELKRVGCYGGEITGTWNLATRRAMSAFMDRANATLPINEPDYVLLALVQGHKEIACAAECPAGQVASGGRCVPRAVVAQASKKSKRLEERRLAAARLAGDRQQVATTTPEQLPWLANDKRADVPVAARTELPGRMSIGGPGVEVSVLPPPESVPAPTPERPQFAIIAAPTDTSAISRSDGQSPADSTRVVALQTEPDVDDLSIDPNAGATGIPLSATEADANVHKKSKSSRSEDRPRRHYAGRSRRGEPRPGTMRYNVVQALGGIY
jgi:hypothetical protein